MTSSERASDLAVRAGLATLTLTAIILMAAFPNPQPGYIRPPSPPLKTIRSAGDSWRGDDSGPLDYGTLTELNDPSPLGQRVDK